MVAVVMLNIMPEAGWGKMSGDEILLATLEVKLARARDQLPLSCFSQSCYMWHAGNTAYEVARCMIIRCANQEHAIPKAKNDKLMRSCACLHIHRALRCFKTLASPCAWQRGDAQRSTPPRPEARTAPSRPSAAAFPSQGDACVLAWATLKLLLVNAPELSAEVVRVHSERALSAR